jgi:hypothetical protein
MKEEGRRKKEEGGLYMWTVDPNSKQAILLKNGWGINKNSEDK